MSLPSKFEIKTKGVFATEILLNGQKLTTVTSVDIHLEPSKLPEVRLTFIADQEILLDEAQIKALAKLVMPKDE